MAEDKDVAALIREMIRQIGEIKPTPIGAMFDFELVDCQPDSDVYCFRCKTHPWMQNTSGALHGGMGAAILDQAMSFVARAIKPQEARTATVQLQVYHHRPIMSGGDVEVTVRQISGTRSLMHFEGEIRYQKKVSISGTGMFFNK